ncbi:MAG: hypothetical protein P0S95_05020 [Rhabdochlamydiaceae bacterium]|nr:hypothetical protein [Candidatus Amphrikana amoebophyrae]
MFIQNIYHFLIHPLDKSHNLTQTTSSIIVNIALTILTKGRYLLAFGAAHLLGSLFHPSPNTSQDLPPPTRSTSQVDRTHFVGIAALKIKQSTCLAKLKQLADQNIWSSLRTHQGEGFDWWMFPTDRPTAGQGTKYTLNTENVKTLLRDNEFMTSYFEGIDLVAQSWGWYTITDSLVTTNEQKWVGYSIRLSKMMHSLYLFSQNATDLPIKAEIETKRRSLTKFIRENSEVQVDAWAQKYLIREP